ncbi:hypothetical protein MTP02_60450 [Streptomyces albus]|nr:hypothetical protein MTP02_60450 [Streptomyces albus]
MNSARPRAEGSRTAAPTTAMSRVWDGSCGVGRAGVRRGRAGGSLAAGGGGAAAGTAGGGGGGAGAAGSGGGAVESCVPRRR